MKVNCDMRVKTVYGVGLNIRSGPNITFPRIGGIPDGNVARYTECENGWYKNAVGWCCGSYLQMVKDYGTQSTQTSKATQTPPAKQPHVPSDWEKELLQSIYKNIDASYTDIDDIRYLFGAPFRFTELTDPVPDGSNLGRTYMETLLSNMSMITIAPGCASYMDGASKDDAKSALTSLFGKDADDSDTSQLQDILTNSSATRYYSFKSDFVSYMEYVNNLCRSSAILLGIGDNKLDTNYAPYKSFDWSTAKLKNKNSKLFSWLVNATDESTISFYIDGKSSSYSDGVSNSVDESMLSSAMGKGSDIAKEALFLFGKSYNSDDVKKASLENYDEAVSNVIDKLVDKDNKLGKRLTDHASTLLDGGNVAFPLLWKDSSNSKSYDISIKLVSPYGDVESFYLYILVPMWFLVALSYPRQVGPNGYMSPFLIRCFCKGW